MGIPVFLVAALLQMSPAPALADPALNAAVPSAPSSPAESDSIQPVSVVSPSGTAIVATEPVAAPDTAPDPAKVSTPPPAQPAPDEGVIVVTGSEGAPPGDPLDDVNAASFAAVQALDNAIVGPAAKVYEQGVPRPLRTGIRNVLHNLAEPIAFVNYLLQLKPGKAAETLGRFAVNTTIGVAGLFDVAKKKPFNLPYRANGFANTLGYYGVGPGPYLYLPLVGPTTVRDLGGRLLDLSLVPSAVGAPFNTPAYSLSNGVLKSLDDRVEGGVKRRTFQAADDPYAAEREWYLAMRAADIAALHGKPAPAPAPVPPIEPPVQPVVTETM